MRIRNLLIENFKSLVHFDLENLKSFCAFVGPNASGKSNIFEALEFSNYVIRYLNEAPRFFGGTENIYTYKIPRTGKTGDSLNIEKAITVQFEFYDKIALGFTAFPDYRDRNVFHSVSLLTGSPQNGVSQLSTRSIRDVTKRAEFISNWTEGGNSYDDDYEVFIDNFSRIFVGNAKLKRINESIESNSLLPDASNLPQVIGKIFEDEVKKNDFIEWLRILIPEFKNIEVKKSNIDGSYDFSIYEKGSERPFPRSLISDGTYNILSLMAAVYQSNKPQFLCIEEPENGLHPQAIELLVDFFREKCDDEGHHIWLNTHSQTLVRCLNIDEIILINKIDGETKAKQFTKEDEVNIKTDEAWLSNALGGGVLWSR